MIQRFRDVADMMAISKLNTICQGVMHRFQDLLPKFQCDHHESNGIVNADRSEILKALLKYKASNTDIVDCILAAQSSSEKVVVSFDRDLEKLKAVIETLPLTTLSNSEPHNHDS